GDGVQVTKGSVAVHKFENQAVHVAALAELFAIEIAALLALRCRGFGQAPGAFGPDLLALGTVTNGEADRRCPERPDRLQDAFAMHLFMGEHAGCEPFPTRLDRFWKVFGRFRYRIGDRQPWLGDSQHAGIAAPLVFSRPFQIEGGVRNGACVAQFRPTLAYRKIELHSRSSVDGISLYPFGNPSLGRNYHRKSTKKDGCH